MLRREALVLDALDASASEGDSVAPAVAFDESQWLELLQSEQTDAAQSSNTAAWYL